MTHPMQDGPGLPFDAPSKLSFNQPVLGGDYTIILFLPSSFLPIKEGILMTFHLNLIFTSQSENSLLGLELKTSL